jgi:hypothetical protein
MNTLASQLERSRIHAPGVGSLSRQFIGVVGHCVPVPTRKGRLIMARLLVLFVALLTAGALSAQATLQVTGTVRDDRRDFILVDIDFGSTPQSVTVSLSIAAAPGGSGLWVDLIDLDDLAATGDIDAADDGQHHDAGTIDLEVTTATYTGLRQVMIAIMADDFGSPSNYSGTLTVSDVAQGDVSMVGKVTQNLQTTGLRFVFDRYVMNLFMFGSSSDRDRNLRFDFGDTPQTMTFYVEAVASGPAEVNVYEIPESGSPILLGTMSGGPFVWADYDNFTTSARTGQVTIRVTTSGSSGNACIWSIVAPSTSPLVATSAPTSSGKKGNSCVASSNSRGGLVLLLAAVLLAVTRTRWRTATGRQPSF